MKKKIMLKTILQSFYNSLLPIEMFGLWRSTNPNKIQLLPLRQPASIVDVNPDVPPATFRV